MNNVLENKLSMYQKVQGFLTLHAADTSTIASVATIKTELDGIVTKIVNSAGVTALDITGFTVQKANKRAELSKATLKMSTAYVAYMRLNNKPQEAEKLDLTPSMLDAMRDAEFYVYASQVSVLATPVVATLAPFGILPADNTALTTKLAEFIAIIQEPRVRIGERSAELENLTRLFEQADDVLTLKLDQVMPVFMLSNLTLYDAYTNARGIDDTGAITAPDYEGTLLPGKILNIAEIPYMDSRTFKVKNLGSTHLSFCLSTQSNVMEGNTADVAPGQTTQHQSSSLNVGANHLLLQNADATQSCDYEIRVIE